MPKISMFIQVYGFRVGLVALALSAGCLSLSPHTMRPVQPKVTGGRYSREDALRMIRASEGRLSPVYGPLAEHLVQELGLENRVGIGIDIGSGPGTLIVELCRRTKGHWINVDAMGLVTVDDETGEIQEAKRTSEAEAILVPVALFFLMFMLVMMGAMPLLQSTMEEKTQRIAEVLLGSMTPFEFMGGKVLGGLLVSLTGATVYVLGGVIALDSFGLGDFIPYQTIPWFFTFLVLEIIMLGSMLAALGSACNDPKDAQNLTFPAMIPVFFPMFIFMPVLQEPTSGFATWLSLFPLFTPMLMLIRTAAPVDIPFWQPWVGLIGVMLFTVFAVWLGGRIFRIGILMAGGPPKLGKIIRWAFRG